MGCSGGGVNGGGQPYVSANIRNTGVDVREVRAKALYEEDELKTVRKSHQNKQVQLLYKEYLERPNGKKSHELLHTHYHEHVILPME
jgi:iron only hydrogenase large subunit-like protein